MKFGRTYVYIYIYMYNLKKKYNPLRVPTLLKAIVFLSVSVIRKPCSIKCTFF
jgi:hypothetical protein